MHPQAAWRASGTPSSAPRRRRPRANRKSAKPTIGQTNYQRTWGRGPGARTLPSPKRSRFGFAQAGQRTTRSMNPTVPRVPSPGTRWAWPRRAAGAPGSEPRAGDAAGHTWPNCAGCRAASWPRFRSSRREAPGSRARHWRPRLRRPARPRTRTGVRAEEALRGSRCWVLGAGFRFKVLPFLAPRTSTQNPAPST